MENTINFDNFRKQLEKAVEWAMVEVAEVLRNEILTVTPRDPKRPPKDLGQRVTGNLKRSIISSIENGIAYAWVSSVGEAVAYAEYLEYGTSRMIARSYIQSTRDNPRVQEKLRKKFESTIRQQLW